MSNCIKRVAKDVLVKSKGCGRQTKETCFLFIYIFFIFIVNKRILLKSDSFVCIKHVHKRVK